MTHCYRAVIQTAYDGKLGPRSVAEMKLLAGKDIEIILLIHGQLDSPIWLHF